MTQMETFTTASLGDLTARLKQAVATMARQDAELLEAEASERSVTNRLSWHLQPLFPDWNLDCEFNCWTGPWQRKGHMIVSTTSAATEARTIFPDLMIHRRRKGDRLAVIEVTLSSQRQTRHQVIKKLRHCQARLACSHALLLEVGVGDQCGEYEIHTLESERECFPKTNVLGDTRSIIMRPIQ